MEKYISIDKIVQSISITHTFDKEKLYAINTSDVLEGIIINAPLMNVSELKGQFKKTIKKGDLLFSEIRPANKRYAKVLIEDTKDYVVSTKLMVLRKFNDDVDFDYFYYCLTNEWFLNILQKRAENRICSFPQITFDLLSEYKFRIPELTEQQRIAKTLSLIDQKIFLNTRMNAELEAMAKQLYDYWFVQFDFPDENGNPYKSSGGEMVYNSALKREIPAGWEVRNLFYIANYYNGLACQNYRPQEGEDSLPVIKITEMHNGFTSETERASANITSEAIIENGDVLFAWSASLEVMLWGLGKGALNQHIFKVTSNNGFPKSFYYFQLMEYVGHFKKIAEAKKTTMGHITKDHLEQSQIVVPPSADLPKKLEKKIAPLMDKIVSLSSERIYLTHLRDSLLPMLMNGQGTVK